MINIKVDVRNDMRGQIKAIKDQLRKLPQESVNKYIDLTPIRDGNARRSTTLNRQNEIVANYPYAEVLDAGRGFRDGQMRGSKQAPQGMTKPFLKWQQLKIKLIMVLKGR